MFLHSKITKLKKLKVWYFFQNGLVHGFSQNFCIFFLRKIGEENVFDDILERKKRF